MLELPPETVYCHVRQGWATVAGLCVVLIAVVAWQSGVFEMLAPVLVSGALLAALTPTVLMIRRRYRHVGAGMLVLTALLALLAAAVHRYGDPTTIASTVDPTQAAIADAVGPR
jgi:predicted PurR-regulated permease PerM